MRPPTMDPMAGERAREVWSSPETPRQIVDPTNPACGKSDADLGDGAAEPRPTFDPTDPRCSG